MLFPIFWMRVRASPSLSEDSCVGSGVVLLLSVFWLQLDGWLLAFLRLPFISAWREQSVHDRSALLERGGVRSIRLTFCRLAQLWL